MNSLLKSSQRKRSVFSVFIRTVIAFCIAILLSFVLRDVVLYAYARFASVHVATDAISEYAESVFMSKYQMDLTIDDLQNRVNILGAELSQYETDTRFAQDTTLFASSSSDFLFARVVSRPPSIPYDMLLLDKGTADGVLVGDVIYAEPGLLPIGSISDVSKYASHAKLLSYPDQKSTIEVGTSTSEFQATGDGNGVFEAQISKNTPVSVGDPVTLPEESPATYATIAYVRSNAADPFVTILFRLPLQFDNLELVGIKK